MQRRLLVLAFGTFAIGTDGFVIAGILPRVADSLDVTVTSAGLLVTVFALAYAILSPVLAAATARWPRRQLLLVALAVFVLGNVATALAPTFGLVLASRVLAAVGASMYTPGASAVAAMLVPAEQRGRALAVVMAGLSGATALGAPIGTAIGGASSWRATMWFVAALGLLAMAGVAAMMPALPAAPPVGLRQRLAPLTDRRVATVLCTTLFVLTGAYTVYTYISVSYDRATGGSSNTLAALLFVFGVMATVGNLGAGSLTDKLGSRWVINTAAVIATVDFALMPFSSRYLASAVVAIAVWGVCGWGILVPQQHRLIALSPAAAPLVIALNAAATYFAVSLSGLTGAAGIHLWGGHELGYLSAVLIFLGLISAELAHRMIRRRTITLPDPDVPVTVTPDVTARAEEESASNA